jgi:hypothetical protein
MVRLIRRTMRPQRIPSEGACLGALGADGCNRLRLRFLHACGLAPASSSFSSQRRITRTGSYAVEDPRDGWYTNSRLAPIARENKWRIGVKKFNPSSSSAKAKEYPWRRVFHHPSAIKRHPIDRSSIAIAIPCKQPGLCNLILMKLPGFHA